MRFRTWPVAALGLAGLLGLIVVFGITTERKSSEIYGRLDKLNDDYREVDARLRQLRSDVHLSGIFVRDYLLDTDRARDPEYLEQLAEFRRSSLDKLAELGPLMPPDGDGRDRTASLRMNLEEYWQAFEPLFFWTPSDKRTQSADFIEREVLPRRDAVMAIAREIEELNNESLDFRAREVTRQYAEYRSDVLRLLWESLLLGGLVTLVAVNRLRLLERRSEEQREVAEAAEGRMRELSQQLVATQEEERKHLSRELHDHVGQVLTGLRMELGRIERLRTPDNDSLATAVGESRALVDDVMRTVRDLALGLRPSMLDDFGLQPALEWLVRDFARRSRVIATMSVEGQIEGLPERYRICVYRSVQEALTNCARHSGASRVEVTAAMVAEGDRPGLLIVVKDNGVGITEDRRANGLGLRGLEERVKELAGTLTIETGFGTGTTIQLWLPQPPPDTSGSPTGSAPDEVAHARVAG